MAEITIKIDGKEVKAKDGEYILNVARENDIFIPAICYLTRCSPTLACRLCVIDVDGKRAYACNAKAKAGVEVVTVSDDLIAEREAIMNVYDLNHPLQCGICDQSGECELQNYTLEMGVSSQNLSIKDTYKPTKDWGLIKYDPALCIVCERCTTVCKDMIGDSALKTVKRGSDAIDAQFKESMPKDSYAVWNKMNKFLIGATKGDSLDCSYCGECVSVCPVGALVSSEFQYTTNAWELEQVPSTCAHCSMGCQIKYESKHTSIDNIEKKLYRVTNEFHYVSLCGAGRFGFDFQNSSAKKDDEAFKKAVEAFSKANSVKFNSYITNEEALILQKLKDIFGFKLVNRDAFAYKKFLENYSQTSGKNLYSADLKTVRESNFVISVGSMLKNDAPNARYALNNSLKIAKGAGIYFHPIEDSVIKSLSKNIVTVAHKPLKEEAILYLVLKLFGKELPAKVVDYINSFDTKVKREVTETVKETIKEKVTGEDGKEQEVEKQVDKKVTKEIEVTISKLFEEAGVAENFEESLAKLLKKKDSFSLIAGADLITHPKAENLAKLLGLIDRYTDFFVLVIPPKTNSLGVSLICDLDEKEEGFVIGYNENGNFKLSSSGDGDLDMPALNQQEGTFVTVDKRVVPINVAVEYGGYILNDIAKCLGVSLNREYTIDYTKSLPVQSGFKPIDFDSLSNSFGNDQSDNRGYLLDTKECTASDEVSEIDGAELSGIVLYSANPISQFSHFTNSAEILKDSAKLFVTSEFLKNNSLEDGSLVKVNDFLELKLCLDSSISGNFAYLPNFDKTVDSESIFDNGYRFAQVNLKKV